MRAPSPRAPLTHIEQQVYHFLLDFLAKHTFQPSVRDIARALRIPSTKSVTDLLAALERKGYVEREPGRSRGVRLVGYAASGGSQPVPVRDPLRDHAGEETFLCVDRRFVGAADAFLLRVGDDSPRAFGVLPGDLVVVQPTARAHDGDLVAIRVGQRVIVRAVTHRGGSLELDGGQSADARMLDSGDDYQVLGVVGAVLRSVPAPPMAS